MQTAGPSILALGPMAAVRDGGGSPLWNALVVGFMILVIGVLIVRYFKK